MTYRDPPQYRSWNVSALGLKTEKPDNDLSYKDRQRPRRESWSPPRGRATRGRGTWGIDNRPQNRRRNTVPNSSQEFNHHAENYESDKQLEGNPILEEPRNLSASPVNDRYDLKIKENNDNDYNDESPFLNRKKHSSDNLYRPPKSRSTSYNKDWKSNSSSDDGSQSRGGYSNGTSKKYEPENYKPQRNNSWEREPTNNDPDQMWVHDKFESLETENVTLINSKDKKDASTQVSPSDINNEIKTINNEIAKETNEPKSPEDSGQSVISAEHPKELSIKLADLTLRDSNVESTMTQTSASEAEPEIISEVTPEVTPEVDPVTPKDEESTVLINLDEDDNADKQTIQPKISQDVFFVDWIGYQKTLFEEECKCTMEQPSKMSNLRKLDTTLKDFDSLI